MREKEHPERNRSIICTVLCEFERDTIVYCIKRFYSIEEQLLFSDLCPEQSGHDLQNEAELYLLTGGDGRQINGN